MRSSQQLDPNQQPGRTAALHHGDRSSAVRTSRRLRLAAVRRSTVVRGGYGLFYEQESSGDRVNNNMVPFRLDQTAFNDQIAAGADDGRLLPRHEADELRSADPSARARSSRRWAATTISASACSSEVAPFTVVELNYVGNIGRFLNGTTNINIPEPAAGGIQARRPFPTSATSTTSTIRWRRPTTRCRPRSSSARTPACSIWLLHALEEHSRRRT